MLFLARESRTSCAIRSPVWAVLAEEMMLHESTRAANLKPKLNRGRTGSGSLKTAIYWQANANLATNEGIEAPGVNTYEASEFCVGVSTFDGGARLRGRSRELNERNG